LKTFTTATTLVIATLDILDVSRILPVLFKRFFENITYRQVYCSLGVFHELAVALLLVSISVAVAVQVVEHLNDLEAHKLMGSFYFRYHAMHSTRTTPGHPLPTK
jgi:hypothetical protein